VAPFLFCTKYLGLDDRAGGAGLCAGAAINAGVGVDSVERAAFLDGAGGALIQARTAGQTCISNLKSHENTSKKYYKIFYHKI